MLSSIAVIQQQRSSNHAKAAAERVLSTIEYRNSNTEKLVLINDGKKMSFGLLAEEVSRTKLASWATITSWKAVKELARIKVKARFKKSVHTLVHFFQKETV